MVGTIPLFGPIPGGPELLIILLVLVLLFGANKIPKLARSTGQAMGEFKKGREEVEDELQQMQEGEMTDAQKEAARTSTEEDAVQPSTEEGSSTESVSGTNDVERETETEGATETQE